MKKNSPWFTPVTKKLEQVISPVTLTAAAMTALVVWQVFPILQAVAAEVRSAVINPSSEANPNLRTLAAVAHRILFTEILVVCEILLIGTIAVLMVRFAFYVTRSIVREIRRIRKELRGISQPRPRVTSSAPKPAQPAVEQSVEQSEAQSQRRLEAPKEKKIYLIPGPTTIQDTRSATGAADGAGE